MYQKIIIAGNLGADPELRYMPNGTAVCNFSVATNRKWKDSGSGEQREEVAWFRVSVFGAQAESCNEYLAKGRQVLAEGRLRPDKSGGPRVFQRQDGTAGASYDLTADNVRFLSSQQGQLAGEQAASQQAQSEEDEIPF
jgi:single-strand DNA-binding protein